MPCGGSCWSEEAFRVPGTRQSLAEGGIEQRQQRPRMHGRSGKRAFRMSSISHSCGHRRSSVCEEPRQFRLRRLHLRKKPNGVVYKMEDGKAEENPKEAVAPGEKETHVYHEETDGEHDSNRLQCRDDRNLGVT